MRQFLGRLTRVCDRRAANVSPVCADPLRIGRTLENMDPEKLIRARTDCRKKAPVWRQECAVSHKERSRSLNKPRAVNLGHAYETANDSATQP